MLSAYHAHCPLEQPQYRDAAQVRTCMDKQVPTMYAPRAVQGTAREKREIVVAEGKGREGQKAQGHDNTHMYEGMSHSSEQERGLHEPVRPRPATAR